jgi:hypothetical protein
MEQNKTTFVLTGFTHDFGFRVFEFDCVDGRTRTRYTVRADLTLVRKYGIHIQELPLLCRRLLDKAEQGEQASFTLPEEEMIACAEKEAARNQAKAHKPWRRPINGNAPGGSTPVEADNLPVVGKATTGS